MQVMFNISEQNLQCNLKFISLEFLLCLSTDFLSSVAGIWSKNLHI